MIAKIFTYFLTSLFDNVSCEDFLLKSTQTSRDLSTKTVFINTLWFDIRSPFEQFVNFTLVAVPNNLWSILNINNLLVLTIILILLLPLLYCLFILIFFLRNQINNFQLGVLNQFEDKTINFTWLTKPYW
jgi:hypothetical protein